MNRRGFLSSILALGVAPAIVKAENIMRIRPLAGGAMYGFVPVSVNDVDYLVPVYHGEIGEVSGTRIMHGGLNDTKAVKRWAAMLAADICRRSAIQERFLVIAPDDSLEQLKALRGRA